MEFEQSPYVAGLTDQRKKVTCSAVEVDLGSTYAIYGWVGPPAKFLATWLQQAKVQIPVLNP